MTQELTRRLAHAADDMPAARVPADLWRRGRRRHRTRRAAAVAAVLAVAALSVLAVAGRPGREAVPAGGPASVPARLHQPWPWQANVDGDPSGPASVLVSGGGTYQTLDAPGTYGSLVGAVGRDGSYRMLRYGQTYLQAGQDALLSPDGRYVAGNGSYERLLGTGERDIAVVDLTTGKERRYPGDGTADPVAWSPDGRRLLIRRSGPPTPSFTSVPYDRPDGEEQRSSTLWLLDPGSGATTRLLDLGRARLGGAAMAPDGRTVAVQAGRDLRFVDAGTGAERSRVTLPVGALLGGPWAYTADGAGIGVFTLAAGCTLDCSNAARNARSWRLAVLSLTGQPDPATPFATFGGATARLAGWQRDGTAVVIRSVDEVSAGDPSYDRPDAYRAVSDVDLLALDPHGGTKVLLDKPAGVVWGLDVAADLVAAGAFGGPSPAPGVFPLARWASITLLVAAAGVGLAGWLVVALISRARRPRPIDPPLPVR